MAYTAIRFILLLKSQSVTSKIYGSPADICSDTDPLLPHHEIHEIKRTTDSFQAGDVPFAIECAFLSVKTKENHALRHSSPVSFF